MARDQDRIEVLAAVGDDADRLDDWQRLALQPAQKRPLAPGGPLRQLLECVERPVVLDEANDVAADPADQSDDPLRPPVFERRLPRKVEEARVARARDQLERGAQATSVGRTTGGRRRST